ncbi:MAG: hypothetical protein RAO92_05310 [Candidatus Euphemobacter frigidus]|nr:hypothetical protein [Candidatus Euphemobacter frigidus]
MQSLRTEIGAEIRAADGRLIRTVPFKACHSLLKQFIQFLYAQGAQLSISARLTDGGYRDLTAGYSKIYLNAGVDATYGPVIGSGETNPVAMDDYHLEAQITANVAHQAPAFATENPDSATWRLAISRGFLNNTGSPVAVKEAGIIARNESGYKYLIERTLYEVSFETGETLTITYRITVSL